MNAATKTRSRAGIIDEIDDFHREIHRHLDELMELVSQLHKLEGNEKLRSKARDMVAFFSGPVREHNYDEERHVFPALRAGSEAGVRQAAETLSEDHAWIELCWLDIETQLAAVGEGVESCDAAALRSGADAFAGLMRDHMVLEESVLYPHLRHSVTPEAPRSGNHELAVPRAARSRR